MLKASARTLTVLPFFRTTPPPQMPSPVAMTAAPWRAQFLEHVDKLDQPTFTFATLHSVDVSPNATAALGLVPRARTCIFRGMWASIPWSPKNSARRNLEAYESDCLTLTTDARMDKVPELFTSRREAGTSSGGGGPVEATFWVAQTATQWRIRGRAWVLSPMDIADTSSPGARAARAAVSAYMRPTAIASGKPAEQWDWDRELVGHFGNISPAMRGSFKNPPPGTARATVKPGSGEGLGQHVGDDLLADEVARKNFRVVVIVPEEVDQCDLSDPADPRRWLYTLVRPATKPDGQLVSGWEKVELWP